MYKATFFFLLFQLANSPFKTSFTKSLHVSISCDFYIYNNFPEKLFRIFSFILSTTQAPFQKPEKSCLLQPLTTDQIVMKPLRHQNSILLSFYSLLSIERRKLCVGTYRKDKTYRVFMKGEKCVKTPNVYIFVCYNYNLD